ncbi:hypothetical protein PPYR_07796 [Photinus pyralis]|uniref:SCP domain-containing protein n=1 Tax=Photinus pyralis TaxID=7054 RepID=A0A5N4ARJ0_PHOPY|nr:venom allergen 5-like [Photinus pyralis]XP_031340634.1 venom allergen 5-like [Photinus pyralis]KAB0799916.1 hypothetical protein PPYR_07796 [Photinus pyralis]
MKPAWSIPLYATTLIGVVCCSCIIYDAGVAPKDQQFIVNSHNTLRTLVAQGKLTGQPKAVNMKRLKWDDKLAAAGQKIAATCNYKHQRVRDPRWRTVGQNIGKTTSSALLPLPNWDKFIQSWFNEYKMYNFTNIPVKGTGHYTQIVWATTEYIGCGYTNYRHNATSNYIQFYVCNYGPGGNVPGMAPYKVGISSQCDNLC